ncbi:TPA: hypothetical protein NBJ98_002672 [Citrobacter freundii]|nr:hypothetical protein [Citrobacter freundii]
MSNKTGGPAFPNKSAAVNGGSSFDSSGMTLRDYFAAKAMQGILANPGQLDNVNDEASKWVAKDAYRVADAMLRARESS